MINRYVVSAVIIMIAVFASYFINFYLVLDYGLSADSAIWAQLGDYVGGVLNPILCFITIVLLIKSLTLQREANTHLEGELINSRKTEKLRSFEVLFFNMINSQKVLFDYFKVDFGEASNVGKINGVAAVFEIEDEISRMREAKRDDGEIREYLDNLDLSHQIFGLSRAFYILVSMISEKLSDAKGFGVEDRREHFRALVNFTDFAQLRMIMICVQFMSFESTKYLKDCGEFKEIIEDLGLGYDLY